MKKLLTIIMIFSLFICSVLPINAQNRDPESISYDGILPNGEAIYQNNELINIVPYSLSTDSLELDYISGTGKLTELEILHFMARIYGTSITYVEGADPTYTLTVTRSKTESSSWSVGGGLGADLKMIKLDVSGDYKNEETATITKGESWATNFTKPGTYELTWYMRGHRYYITGDVDCYKSDGSYLGSRSDVRLGAVLFPTDEIHFDITRQ
ncbi:hypothetical protein [Vallitalea guaymasensis]|uniref:hypothetical protein n=1 Tax=Vallitalea guaymasensis TaxID=1185412 RepID=UPI000DE3B2BD|nr:hypothetical protein [Vallitalea guaymasensis]